MIRDLFLCFICFGVVHSSWDSEIPEFSVCEEDETLLDLSYSGIENINGPIAKNSTIKCLNLAGNNISTISANAFNGLPELRYLNLSNNPLNKIKLKGLSKLKTLVLDNTNNGNNSWALNRLKKNRLPWVLPELERLYARYNGIFTSDNCGKSIFDVPKLTHLYLTGSRSKIKCVTMNMLKNNSITHLYMDNTNTTTIHDIRANNLRYLSLNNNSIKFHCSKSGLPLHMDNLEYLSLASNGIRCIFSAPFDYTKKLRFLNLAGNSLKNCSIVKNLTNLQNLTLDNNRLSWLPNLSRLEELRFLSVKNNIINIISKHFFPNQSKLETLLLSDNKIYWIQEETFINLRSLAVLDLSGNRLSDFRSYFHMPQNSIVKLILDKNPFLELPFLCSLKELQYFSYNNNIIGGGLQSYTFCKLPKLETVLMRNNGMWYIPKETFGHLPSLAVLDVSDNDDLQCFSEYEFAPRKYIEKLYINNKPRCDFSNISYVDHGDYITVGRNPIEVKTV